MLPFKQIVQLIDKQKYRVLILLVCDYLLQKLQLLLEGAGDDLGQLFEDEVENGFRSFKGHRIELNHNRVTQLLVVCLEEFLGVEPDVLQHL